MKGIGPYEGSLPWKAALEVSCAVVCGTTVEERGTWPNVECNCAVINRKGKRAAVLQRSLRTCERKGHGLMLGATALSSTATNRERLWMDTRKPSRLCTKERGTFACLCQLISIPPAPSSSLPRKLNTISYNPPHIDYCCTRQFVLSFLPSRPFSTEAGLVQPPVSLDDLRHSIPYFVCVAKSTALSLPWMPNMCCFVPTAVSKAHRLVSMFRMKDSCDHSIR